MLISIPPKFVVSSVIGYIKGESTIHVARHFFGKVKNYTQQSIWARGYFVSTTGVNDDILEYIRHQEKDDRRIEQLELFQQNKPPYEDVNEP